jgi:hypothetical protein
LKDEYNIRKLGKRSFEKIPSHLSNDYYACFFFMNMKRNHHLFPEALR